jgi:hypothetical protein
MAFRCGRVRWPACVSTLAATLFVAAALLAPASAAAASIGLERVGSAARIPTGSQLLGALDKQTALHLTVALEPRDPLALEAYATGVATPGSSDYRHYLSPAQFAFRFGATATQIQQVEQSLRARGLTPGKPSANALSIPVTASAGKVETAFQTTLQRLQLPHRVPAIANRTAPLLPAAVAPLIQSVVGLQTVATPRPLLLRRPASAAGQRAAHDTAHVVTGGPQPCAAATAAAPPQSAYTIDQIASAYGFPGLYQAGDQGQGETIALYELESDDPADIDAYQACYGTHAAVQDVPVDGGAGSGPGSGEAALDIETAIGLAPKANFLVYQAPNSNFNGPGAGPYDLFSAIVSQDRAQVVSASWGQCEALEGASDAAAEQSLFEEAAVQGQTFVSASGDSGSEDCFAVGSGATGTQLAVDDPSSQPFVLGVGGTTLPSIGPPPSESVWNAGCALLDLTCGTGATGGGISSLWTMPAYQSQAAALLNVGTGTCSRGRCREVPDVSADADPNTGYLIYWNGSGTVRHQPTMWQGIGGTSAAAPTWAALIALVNDSAGCKGMPLGFANPALYRAAGVAYSTDFNDVTTGNNDYTGTNGGNFGAGPGYDPATGLGTPKASALAQTLCAESLRVASPAAQTSTVGHSVRLQLRASDGAGTSVAYAASGLPAGLSLNSATGVISGTPRTVEMRTVTIAARDSQAAVGSATFTWTIVGSPKVSGASLNGLAKGHPTLSFMLTAGTDEPALKSFSIGLPHGLKLKSKRGLTVSSAGSKVRHSASIKHGRLLIALHTPAVRVQIVIASLSASPALVQDHKKTLNLFVTSADASGTATALTIRLKR